MSKIRKQLEKLGFISIGGYCYQFNKKVFKPETNENLKIGVNIDFGKDYMVLNIYETKQNGRKALDRMGVSKKAKEILDNIKIFFDKGNITGENK